MAQQALGPGTAVPRRRALFGLLDADGWGWASVKAFVWLIFIIFILGYLPDRAYYLTVGRTVDLGVLVWSPINLCPPSNETLPCPAPVGALVPWQPSPPELNLPEPRTDGSAIQVGTQIFYIGGSDGQTAKSDLFVAETVQTGNFDKWAKGPIAARAAGRRERGLRRRQHLRHRRTRCLGRPDQDRLQPQPGQPDGRARRVEHRGRSGPAGRPQRCRGRDHAGWPAARRRPERRRAGRHDLKTLLNSQGALGAWSQEQSLNTPQADATAALVGDYLWLYGGSDANGPTTTIQRGAFGQAAAEGLPANPDVGKLSAGTSTPRPTCRSPARTRPAGPPTARSTSPAATTAGGPKSELYWAVPTNAGDLPEWKHLAASDLPAPPRGRRRVVSGPRCSSSAAQTDAGVSPRASGPTPHL